MNWYFEVEGVSKGPYEEAEFAQMVQRREVPADSLIWKPDMTEWATVREINPPWAKLPAAAGKMPATPKGEPAPATSEPTTRKTKAASATKREPALSEEAPVIEAALPTDSAALPRTPEPSKLKLQAPTPASEPPAQPDKGGLLKRVFGFGKKK